MLEIFSCDTEACQAFLEQRILQSLPVIRQIYLTSTTLISFAELDLDLHRHSQAALLCTNAPRGEDLLTVPDTLALRPQCAD